MTTITLSTAPSGRVTLLQRMFLPHEKLSAALDTLASASNVSPPWLFKVFNAEGDQLNLTPQRSVGAQPLFVEVEATAVHALQAKLEQQGSDLADLKQAVAKLSDQMMGAAQILLMICAAQILKTALGAPFETTRSRQVQTMEADPTVVRLAGLAGVTPADFAVQADNLIDRRNNTAARHSSCAQLEVQVAGCQALMTPALRQKHKWESWMVDNYGSIKELAPDRFC